MRSGLLALVLFATITLAGCRFVEWATTVPPGGTEAPAFRAVQEVATGGLSGFETGGIVAGVIGLVFTVLKTSIRLHREYAESVKITKVLGPKTTA